MSDVVIAVRNLSKQYRLGAKEKQADTFFGSLRNMVAAPFKNYKQIRNLTRNAVEDETLFWALRDINFEVKQGEVLGIIGHNGAGKSTLLKILSRITDPTTGEIMIKGRVSALLEVGTGFHPELTGRENVYMNGTILGMTKKEITRKFDEIIDFSGIEKHIDTPVKFYSSGMKVRLAFAVAAHLEPELLIIDEVLAVGDAEFQKKCIGKMEDVASEGRTVLFVSHDLMAITNLCSRAILLKSGGIIADDSTTNVISKYRNIDSAKSTNELFVLRDELKKVKSNFFSSTSLKIIGENSGNAICLNEDVFFEIEYENHSNVSLTAEVAIVLKSQNLIPVVTFNTMFQKKSIRILSQKGKITCNVKDLLLVPGKYYIHLWISLNGEVAEIIENAGSVEIIEGDVFRSGVIPNQRNHGFLIHTNYSFKID